MNTPKQSVLNSEAGISETINQNPETQIVAVPSNRATASRRNGSKSRGPKTLQGKARSSGNSRKLGLLAKEIIGANEDNPKVRAEFNALLAAVREDLSPVGALEDMQVDVIVACYWRLARVLRFELRQANRAVTVDGECLPSRGDDDVASDDILKQIRRDPEGLAQKLERSVEVIQEYIDLLEPDDSPDANHLDPEDIERLRNVPGDLWQRCVALYPKGMPHFITRSGEGDERRKACMQCGNLLEELREQLPWVQRWKDICIVVQRNPELRALVMRPDIPDAQAIERILRYEPMLHRQLNKAMDQLERLQRRRKGEAVPPPVNAHVSLEH